jgi:hypothetical protein
MKGRGSKIREGLCPFPDSYPYPGKGGEKSKRSFS